MRIIFKPGLKTKNTATPNKAPVMLITNTNANAVMLILPFDLGSSDAVPTK